METDNSLNTNYQSIQGLTNLEKELLTEYQKLANNLNELSRKMSILSTSPKNEILDSFEALESKIALAYTLLQSSAYSLFLQEEIDENDELLDEQEEYDSQY